MTEALPHFKYHPDPLATGSIEASKTACLACGKVRGYIYTGPVYCEEEIDGWICPWCIADGTAHKKFDAEFTDMGFISGYNGEWGEVAKAIAEEVSYRTPGFTGWQQEKWFTHCNDAAAFLGMVGYEELKALGPEAIKAIQDEEGLDDEEWEDYFETLHIEVGPTAYIFRCLHCGAYGGYSDMD